MQVKVALAVIEQVDCLTQRLLCLLQLCGLFQLARDAGERPATDPQANARVGADVPDPVRVITQLSPDPITGIPQVLPVPRA